MEDDAAIQQERDIKFGFHTGRYEPSFFVPFVSPFSRGPSGFLPARVAVMSSRSRFDGVDAKARGRRDMPRPFFGEERRLLLLGIGRRPRSPRRRFQYRQQQRYGLIDELLIRFHGHRLVPEEACVRAPAARDHYTSCCCSFTLLSP